MDKNFTNNDELLIACLDGELSPVEELEISKQIAAHAPLQSQYDSLLVTREAIRQYGLQQRVAGIHEQMMKELNTPVRSITTQRKIFKLIASVAAAAILFIAGYWFFNNQPVSAEKLYSENYTTYKLPITRSDNTETAISKAFNEKNYQQVLQLADKLPSPNAEMLFIAGIAAMELNNPDVAIQKFNSLLENNKLTNSVTYKDDAEFYLALSYLKKYNYTPAYNLLKKIKAEKEHTYNSRATNKFLNELKELTKK